MTPSRTCSSENGSIIRGSRAMRRIQRPAFTDIGPPLTRAKGFHGDPRAATHVLDRTPPLTGPDGRNYGPVKMWPELLVMAGVVLGLPGETGKVTVVLRTTVGDIVLEVDTDHAPKTAANFLRYVDGGYYEGGRFHRTVRMDNQPDKKVKIEVVQAGPSPTPAREGFPPI